MQKWKLEVITRHGPSEVGEYTTERVPGLGETVVYMSDGLVVHQVRWFVMGPPVVVVGPSGVTRLEDIP
jgi:hypothetical protein